jgi:hypothetical protein
MNDVSEDCIVFIMRVTRIGEPGTTVALTSWFLQEPYDTISQKTTFFIVAAVKASDLS